MWFGRSNANPRHQVNVQQAQQLLVPDPPLDNEEVAEAGGENQPQPEQPTVNMPATNYDAQHADDEAANAMEKAVNVLKNFPWTQDDIAFYFSQVEVKMKTAGVKSNFTKLQVLSTILPPKAIHAIKNILKKQETEFPNKDAYLQAKQKLTRVFGPCENADFERAMARVMTDKPSQLMEELMSDLCDRELKNCCCLKVIGGLWRRAMPSSVRQAIAHYDFTRQNLPNIMQVADDVFESTKPASAQIAAVTAPTDTPVGLSLSEAHNKAFAVPKTQEEASAQIASLAAQVAAIQKSFRGRGGRGGRGRGRGNGARGGGSNSTPQYSAANPRHKTPRHPDLPPFGVCRRHWQFGKSSFTCLEPYTCEWKNFIQPKPSNSN